MPIELWTQPWAYFAGHRRIDVGGAQFELRPENPGAVFVYHTGNVTPTIDRPTDPAEPFAEFRVPGGTTRKLALLPFPLSPRRGLVVRVGAESVRIVWPDAPDRPREKGPGDVSEPGVPLMQRARAVWDRIQDVEEALEDPAKLWQALHDRWTGSDADQPQMHVIVRQAREMARVLDMLERRPRRVLRREQRMLPVGRVQEIDRRAMLWLARQSGDKLAEKAGDRQRIRGVAREENYDTLENRVLRAYAELVARVGRDYIARNAVRRRSRRAIEVERFMRRALRLARDLAKRGVRLAEPGVIPNFVLQQNTDYRAVWDAWKELREQDRIEDELWRWQARSWSEYCALALMVALIGVDGAQVVATAPIWFREEQHRGSWIDADRPLGVIYLPQSGLIVELRGVDPGRDVSRLGASFLLAISRANDNARFEAHIPVWPIWAERGGLAKDELSEVVAAFPHLGQGVQLLRGGIVIRPASSPDHPEISREGGCVALALGMDGPALRETLLHLTRYLNDALKVEVA